LNTFSNNQRLQASDIFWAVHPVGYNDSKLASDAGKEYICFSGFMISGMSSCDAHIHFEVVDCPFYRSSYFIERIPFIRIALDTWKHAEFHILVGVSGSAFLCGAAGFFTVTDPFSFYHMYFGTAPFHAVGTTFFLRKTTVFHRKSWVIWTGRITIFIESDFFEGTFITRIIGNQHFFKMELIL
jgi:hypothetical protein